MIEARMFISGDEWSDWWDIESAYFLPEARNEIKMLPECTGKITGVVSVGEHDYQWRVKCGN